MMSGDARVWYRGIMCPCQGQETGSSPVTRSKSVIIESVPNGVMAEWLGDGLQNRLPRFNSGSRLQGRTGEDYEYYCYYGNHTIDTVVYAYFNAATRIGIGWSFWW